MLWIDVFVELGSSISKRRRSMSFDRAELGLRAEVLSPSKNLLTVQSYPMNERSVIIF